MAFKRIRDLREDNDDTQKEIADYLYLNCNVYWRYEIGERAILTWVIIKLAKFYGVTIDDLLGRSDRKHDGQG